MIFQKKTLLPFICSSSAHILTSFLIRARSASVCIVGRVIFSHVVRRLAPILPSAEDSASDSSRIGHNMYVEEALAAHVPLQHVVRILRTSCLPTSTINMSNSWADESEMGDDDGVGIGGREVQQPQQRPRLQLKPRSQNPASEHTSSTSSTTTSKSNPFGAAKPREEGELIYGSSQVILVLDQHIYQSVPSTSLYISVAL